MDKVCFLFADRIFSFFFFFSFLWRRWNVWRYKIQLRWARVCLRVRHTQPKKKTYRFNSVFSCLSLDLISIFIFFSLKWLSVDLLRMRLMAAKRTRNARWKLNLGLRAKAVDVALLSRSCSAQTQRESNGPFSLHFICLHAGKCQLVRVSQFINLIHSLSVVHIFYDAAKWILLTAFNRAMCACDTRIGSSKTGNLACSRLSHASVIKSFNHTVEFSF